MHVTPSTLLISIAVFAIIVVIRLFFLHLAKYAPYEKNGNANDALFYIHMIKKDYFSDFQWFPAEKRVEVSYLLNHMAKVFDLDKMRDRTYRTQLEGALNTHYKELFEVYHLFASLRMMTTVTGKDIQFAVNRTDFVFSQLMNDVEKVEKPVIQEVA